MADTKQASGKKEEQSALNMVDKPAASPLDWIPLPFFLLRATFEWMTPLIVKGWRRPLEMSDIYELPKNDQADQLMVTFNKNWEYYKNSGKHALLKTMHATFGHFFWFCAFLALLAILCQTGSPLFIRYIGEAMRDPTVPEWQAYVLAVGMFLTTLLGSFFTNQYWNYAFNMATRIRTAMTCKIYEKAVLLSSKARQYKTSGEIVNLMSVDTQKLSDISAFFLFGSVSIVQVAISLGLLFWLLEWTPLVGFGSVIFLMPLQAFVMKFMLKTRGNTVGISDERIKTINEILQGIRIIKFFTWEESFTKKVGEIRGREVKQFGIMGVLRAGLMSLMTASPLITTMVTFIVYFAYKNSFNPATLFTALAYFNIMRMPMALLPMIMVMGLEAVISINRIQELFLQEEHIPRAKGTNADYPVVIKNANFEWEVKPEAPKKEEKKRKSIFQKKAKPVEAPAPANPEATSTNPPTDTTTATESKQVVKIGKLQNIDVQVPKGKLCMIVGAVGSGKSNLLSAIIGEMKKLSGDVEVTGSVAYCSQQAWIQNATLKDNILFGVPFDKDRYEQVIDVCALRKDLEVLPNGEKTEIGEKGINLSGGQRQRTSLARAVYTNRDVYLLDDVLSAVDTHVGRWIFEKCITSYLKDKTRLFVTHQIQYLKYADHIILLGDGNIVEQGTYNELMEKKDGALNALVSEYLVKDKEEDEQAKGKEHKVEEKAEVVIVKKDDEAAGKLTQAEERQTGTVAFSVLWNYCYNMGLPLVFVVFCMYVLAQCCLTMGDLWLSFWSEVKFSNLTWQQYMGIYGGLGALGILAVFIRETVFSLSGLRAALHIHDGMFNRVIFAPMSFFDATPIGRVLSRFAKDQEQVDSTMIMMIANFLTSIFGVLAIIGIIAYAIYWFLIPFAVLGVVYLLCLNFFRSSAREIKRLESIMRSPVFNHFSESLSGIATIRAYNEEDNFIERVRHKTDAYVRVIFAWNMAQRWLNFRLDLLGSLLVACGCILIVGFKNSLSLATASLGLSYTISITSVLSMTVRNFAEAEAQLACVERITFYTKSVPVEPPAVIPSNRPPKEWPTKGEIEFKDFCMRYRADLPLVLKNLSLIIQGGEKVGVVGRTGSGKSSTMLALYRIVEGSQGSILIDGVDIGKIGLKDLRSQLSIIPQEPVLFSGTVRSNLDPFNEYDDKHLWECLEKAHLKRAIEADPAGLGRPVAEGGENYSVGERQLMCLARALTKQVKVLIMDEATASVDFETDALIQKTVREAFTSCTRLTIAHRLNTIVDSDKVLVLDKGNVAEFDSPKNLVLNKNSVFNSMIEETGAANAEALKRVALGEAINQTMMEQLSHVLLPEAPPVEQQQPSDNLVADLPSDSAVL